MINEMFCQAQLPYSFSDKLHVTLCPARLKKLRPIQIIVTCQQVQDQLLWFSVKIYVKRYDATTLFGPF